VRDQTGGLNLVHRAIDEMNNNNWQDIIGLVEDNDFSEVLKKEFYEMLT
jgi:hypothetical protein